MNHRAVVILVVLIAGVAARGAQIAAQSPHEPAVHVRAFAYGIGRHTPGRWAPLGVQASNTTDSESESMISIYFDKDTNTQYARRLWIPAQAIRISWMPVQVPTSTGQRRDSIEYSMMTLKDSPQGEIIERTQGQEMMRTALLLIDREPIKTAGIFRKPMPDSRGSIAELDVDAYELMAEARKMNENTRIIMDMTPDFVPSHSMMWETLDQVVLCSDRIVNDTAGLAVLRDWLHRGGKLCIFLDRVSTDTVASILGHNVSFQIIDRVELDEFSIQDTTAVDQPLAADRRRFEQPVELVRVATSATDIQARIGPWPAAFWERAGMGEVLFVTLGPRGWLPAPVRPGDEELPEFTDPEFRQTHAIRALSERFYRPRTPKIDAAGVVEPLLQETIGYRIPSRTLATTLLGLNCAALVVVGAWCSRVQRLDRLAWIVPGLSLVATFAFLGIGWANSKGVPATVAYTQLIHVFPDTDEASVTGLAAFYHQEMTKLSMTGGAGGAVSPTGDAPDGVTRRLVWRDNDRGQWINVALPGGSVQFAKFQQPAKLTDAIRAAGRFGENGFEGRIDAGPLGKFEDSVIANPPAAPAAIRMNADGTFVCGPQDVLSDDQYLAQSVVSDESRRRQMVYRSVLDSTDNIPFPPATSVLGWSGPLPCGLDWPTELQSQGSALATIPLKIHRTQPGKRFLIPATFLRAELSAGQSGRSMSYNPRTGKWLAAASRTTNTRLRFPIPEEVLPGRVTDANLTIKINAPSRSLKVYAVVDGKDQLAREIANPSGVYSIAFDKPEWVQMDQHGGLRLTIEITEATEERELREAFEKSSANSAQPNGAASEQPGSKDTATKSGAVAFSTWQIDYVRLDVRGETL